MNVQPLSFLEPGSQAKIKDIIGGKGINTKLAEMGFVSGSILSVLRNDGSGPMLVAVMDSRVAIGRGMAQKIMAERIA